MSTKAQIKFWKEIFFTDVFKNWIKHTNLSKTTPKKLQKISIWPFLLTGIQVPDTSIDQAHMQLPRSYTITYADSSSNGIIWNIEKSLGKFHLEKFWRIKNERCFFSENDVENFLATLMESEFELFLF